MDMPSNEIALIGGRNPGPHHEALWPGNTYRIVERVSGLAITNAKGVSLSLDHPLGPDPCQQWLCVEKNGYFGLHNKHSGTYFGQVNESAVHASATTFGEREYLTTRHHPQGGYQLLMPYEPKQLKMLVFAAFGGGLVMRQHEETLWSFVRIPAPC